MAFPDGEPTGNLQNTVELTAPGESSQKDASLETGVFGSLSGEEYFWKASKLASADRKPRKISGGTFSCQHIARRGLGLEQAPYLDASFSV